jgi:hypothetical protein
MKPKRRLLVLAAVGVLALIVAGYCFWLMTVPLSYDLVYLVVGGFIVASGVSGVAFITSVIIAFRLRRSRPAMSDSEGKGNV